MQHSKPSVPLGNGPEFHRQFIRACLQEDLSSAPGVMVPGRTGAWKLGALGISSLLGLYVGSSILAGIALGGPGFCAACLAFAKYRLKLDRDSRRTFSVVTLVCSDQAFFYVARERSRLWRSRSGLWMLASSCIDLALICTLAASGWLMKAPAFPLIAGILGAALHLALLLDTVELRLFRHQAIA